MRIYYLQLLFFLFILFLFDANAENSQTTEVGGITFLPVENCRYEKLIQEHQTAITKKRATSAQIRAHARYVDMIAEIERYDEISHFQMSADHEGTAWLKFDTPEELVREKVKKILSHVSQGLSDEIEMPGLYQDSQENLQRAYEKAKEKVEELEAVEKGARTFIRYSERKDSKLLGEQKDALGIGTDKMSSTPDKIFRAYQELRRLREETLQRLKRAANLSMCLVVHGAPLSLAKLYHSTIKNDNSCNEMERKTLLDSIRRLTGPTHGVLYNKENFDEYQTLCSLRWARLDESSRKEPAASGSNSGSAGYMSKAVKLSPKAAKNLTGKGSHGIPFKRRGKYRE